MLIQENKNYNNRIGKLLSIVALLIFSNLLYGQGEGNYFEIQKQEYQLEKKQAEEQETNMFKVLWKDYWENEANRSQKRECYKTYSKMFLQSLYSQLTAPFGYVVYYIFKKPITHRIENLYAEKQLNNIDNIGKDILKGNITEEELREALKLYYGIWLYGDTDDPIVSGGVPKDYKTTLPMSIRRWLYCGVRNPRWNATYLNFYSDSIVEIRTTLDNRQDIVTHNYGTGDTKLGNRLRWYIDKQGKWWFFYENTKRTKENKGKLFYFGAVRLSNKEDGLQGKNSEKSRFEFSLNREVSID